jgi:CheY-like chemotaxis protein
MPVANILQDGVALLKQLKDLSERATTPILALSVHAMPRDIEWGIAARFFEHPTKPLDGGKFRAGVCEIP